MICCIHKCKINTHFQNSSMYHNTWSSPRCPLRSHSLLHSKNNSYSVGIGPIRDVELTWIFWSFFYPFVRCIEDRYRYYKIIFNTHLFSNVVFMTLNYVLYLILVKNPEKGTFWRYASVFPALTHSYKQQHHSTTLPLYHLYRANIEWQGFNRGQPIVVREIVTLM